MTIELDEGDQLIAELVPDPGDATVELPPLTASREVPPELAHRVGNQTGRIGLPIWSCLVSLVLGGPAVWLILLGIPGFVANWVNARTAGLTLWRFDMTEVLYVEHGAGSGALGDVGVIAIVACCLTLACVEQLGLWSKARQADQ